MYQNDPKRVLTCECRLSYCNLVEPRKVNPNDPNEKAKYSVTLLIPKNQDACVADIMASIEAAHQEAINGVWKGLVPQYAPILHDGDGCRPDGQHYGPECAGCWVITASTVRKPQVVHQSNIKVELAPTDIYSGMYARVTINFYGYANRQKGIACGLGNVMKTKDGDPLSGGSIAANDFEGLEQAAPAYPQANGYAPQGQAAPVAQPYSAPAPNYAAEAAPVYQPPVQQTMAAPTAQAQQGATPQSAFGVVPGYGQ